jgi:pimeloyl-ACP methyl ester carboxylesterase
MPGWCGPRDVFRPLYPHLQRRALAVDWRGHGGSDPAPGDFGIAELTEDALAVITAAKVDRVIPVGLSHAGWVAIELRKRLGADRVPGVALIDWMVLGGPPPFFDALQGLQRPETWSAVRERLFGMWTTGVDNAAVRSYVGKMGEHGFDMWARAGREIAKAFAAAPVPLELLKALGCPTLHAYAQPADPAFFAAQQEYARANPWFRVQRVSAASHFPMFETPVEMAAELESFARTIAE